MAAFLRIKRKFLFAGGQLCNAKIIANIKQRFKDAPTYITGEVKCLPQCLMHVTIND